MWKALLYVKSEIAEEKSLLEWIYNPQNGIVCKDVGDFPETARAANQEQAQGKMELQISEACRELCVDVSECLMIVTTEEQWKETQEMDLAALPYEKPDMQEKFLGAWLVVQGFENVDHEFLNRVYLRHHNLPWVMLETPRLFMRELSLSDMDDLFALYEDPRVTQYTEGLYAREKELEYQEAYIRNMYRFFGYGMWLVCRKDTGEVIGRAGLEHRLCNGQTELEMGYLIAPEEWHKGYATEVCQALVEYAKRELDFLELNCFIQKGNAVSVHLAEKLGFSYAGETEVDGKMMLRYVMEL